MKYNVSLTAEAELDLADALDYYAKISISLSDKLFREIDLVMESLAKYPKHHPERYNSIRIASTANFSYGVHYTLLNSQVKVIRVLHHKQYYGKE